MVLPVVFEDRVLAVIELASFHPFSEVHLAFLDQLTETIGVTVNTITASSRTEELLAESQRLAQELQERSEQLQGQQEELRKTNTELKEKAALLAEQNRAIEVKNVEIEQARRTLEERAEQLSLSSRYKSEFLANMSHELRTPLNSLLILARLLADNQRGNLTDEQVEHAATIHRAGSDLLQLINDILDLSKVEAGKMDVQPADVPVERLVDYVDATFRPLTADKGLGFAVTVQADVPTSVHTDERRLQQILRNLLSNAVKFTETGEVRLAISTANRQVLRSRSLRAARCVLAFGVLDTGIGIPEDKLQVIFEAFQQADGTTNRRYGGTGLGLSISREIAQLLGGEIHTRSTLGAGSTFTLYLPAALPADGSADTTAEPGEAVASERGQVTAPLGIEALAEAAARATNPPAAEGAAPVGSVDGPPGLPRVGFGPGDDPGAANGTVLAGKRVLVVDDDVRNVFALAAALEQHGIEVSYAEDGPGALVLLEGGGLVDLVLMDIMMPGMDGNQTMAEIRARPQFADLPIIALTAKAMPGDREKSLAAGASDYVTKPVDLERLLRVLRARLAR